MKTELLCLKKALEGAHPIALSLLRGLWSPLLYINLDFLIKIKFRNTGFSLEGESPNEEAQLIEFLCLCFLQFHIQFSPIPASCVCVQSCLTLSQPYGPQPARLLCQWDYPGKNTGVGCHFLLQGLFPIQRSNLRLGEALPPSWCTPVKPLALGFSSQT